MMRAVHISTTKMSVLRQGLERSGIFDPFGFSKGNLKEMQTKEIKNGRCAALRMLA